MYSTSGDSSKITSSYISQYISAKLEQYRQIYQEPEFKPFPNYPVSQIQSIKDLPVWNWPISQTHVINSISDLPVWNYHPEPLRITPYTNGQSPKTTGEYSSQGSSSNDWASKWGLQLQSTMPQQKPAEIAQQKTKEVTIPTYHGKKTTKTLTKEFVDSKNKFEGIVYIPVSDKNGFIPELPTEKVDMIYLCFPNNPTGTVLNKKELKKWVDYAKENKAIILFDSAYERYITEENIPHSIYEVEGAKEVAIEFRSFSKTAGFTGVRCAYTIVPKELYGYTENGDKVSINKLWNRRQCTKFNGVSYVTQRAAEAIYSEQGQKEIEENIKYYMENAKIIREGLKEAGFTVYGGVNAPYIWLKCPEGLTSWEFFDKLLQEKGIVGTPGVGFGPSGEGFFRLTAFGSRENTIKAIEKIKNN